MMPMLLCMTPPAQAETTEWPCSNDDEIHYTAASEVYKGTSELSYIYNEVKFISDRLRVQEAQIAYEDEWKYAALVLDRLACPKSKRSRMLSKGPNEPYLSTSMALYFSL